MTFLHVLLINQQNDNQANSTAWLCLAEMLPGTIAAGFNQLPSESKVDHNLSNKF